MVDVLHDNLSERWQRKGFVIAYHVLTVEDLETNTTLAIVVEAEAHKD